MKNNVSVKQAILSSVFNSLASFLKGQQIVWEHCAEILKPRQKTLSTNAVPKKENNSYRNVKIQQ